MTQGSKIVGQFIFYRHRPDWRCDRCCCCSCCSCLATWHHHLWWSTFINGADVSDHAPTNMEPFAFLSYRR